MDFLPEDIENLICEITGDSHFVISQMKEFEKLYKATIPLNDVTFLINDAYDIFTNIKCNNCRNLSAECLFYKTIIDKCEKYEKMYKNHKKIIFNYEINRDIALYDFYLKNYRNFMKELEVNKNKKVHRFTSIKSHCKCFECNQIIGKINRLRIYKNLEDIDKLFEKLRKSKMSLLKILKLKDKSHMFFKTLTIDTFLI